MSYLSLKEGVRTFYKDWASKSTLLTTATAPQAAAPRTELVIDGSKFFPGSITSTRDGTIITVVQPTSSASVLDEREAL